ncbi:MAG: right-handed parallel beta-helix repeat-containing protein [Clostridiales bacterium]|nr:right-handed parallel beta-helix repeat-containing protein [Clostridiales bacterium]
MNADEYRKAAEIRAVKLAERIYGAEPEISGGVRYYISSSGDDSADGLSPESAWSTLAAVDGHEISPGSVVLFRRGDIWRGSFAARPGVTYSSYGTGDLPALYGSPFDGAKDGCWKEVFPKVWRYSEKLRDDCGGIVFDGGRYHGYKRVVNWENGVPSDNVSREPFRGYFDLTEDLSFWHDLGREKIHDDAGGYVYLRSELGDPAKRFGEIEFLPRVHGISVKGGDVTIDGLRVMYCGAHGIAAGTVSGLTVRNSVIGWIGGGLQYYRDGRPVRFGNGIEIYGGCVGYTVENCHVYQCYDAGITFQYSSGGSEPVYMDRVRIRDNLIEDCVYSVEYFLGRPDDPKTDRQMRDIVISGNVMRRAGYGWGIQRPDKTTPAHIKSWDHFNRLTGRFDISGNLFDLSRHMMLHISAEREEWMPGLEGNTYIQSRGADLGRIGAIPTSMAAYTDEILQGTDFGKETFLYY